jgi:hypothetical protein
MAITSVALAFANRWFDPATVARVFEPLIADWERELLDTPSSRRVRVGGRGLAAFICAVLVSSPSFLGTRAPRTVTSRVAIRITRFISLASVLLTLPFLSQMLRPGFRAVMLLGAASSAIAVALPLSMIGAVDAIRRHDPIAPHVERALVVKLGVIAVVFMIVFDGFMVPTGNEMFRATMAPAGAPAVSVRELTTYQLMFDPTLAAPQEPYTGGADRATRIQRELNNRAALALLPAVLLWIRWRAIDTGRGRWWSPLPAPLTTTIVAAAFIVTTFYGFFLERDLDLAAGTGFWLPIAAFAAWAATCHLRQRLFLRLGSTKVLPTGRLMGEHR